MDWRGFALAFLVSKHKKLFLLLRTKKFTLNERDILIIRAIFNSFTFFYFAFCRI